jgi:enoyl-CoA hydratase/carnithine racemase
VQPGVVVLEVADRVATVTLNRPEVRNAFDGRMASGLAAALGRCDTDDEIRAVVLTGAPPAFCSGADLSAGGETFGAPSDGFSAAGLPVAPWQVRKPVIAAVNGHAIGIGFTLTLQCDIRIFAADASYGVVQVRRGVLGDAYSHWTLPRIAGMDAAAEILLSGRTFDGREARELGVCRRVLPNDEVLPAAQALARDIATYAAPLSVAYSKKLLWATWRLNAPEVEALETKYHRYLMGGPDAREGVAAFLEKRLPQWTGRVNQDWREG